MDWYSLCVFRNKYHLTLIWLWLHKNPSGDTRNHGHCVSDGSPSGSCWTTGTRSWSEGQSGWGGDCGSFTAEKQTSGICRGNLSYVDPTGSDSSNDELAAGLWYNVDFVVWDDMLFDLELRNWTSTAGGRISGCPSRGDKGRWQARDNQNRGGGRRQLCSTEATTGYNWRTLHRAGIVSYESLLGYYDVYRRDAVQPAIGRTKSPSGLTKCCRNFQVNT